MIRDKVGIDFTDLDAAYREGLLLAKEKEGYARFGMKVMPGWYIEVTTQNGEICWRLPIGNTENLQDSVTSVNNNN